MLEWLPGWFDAYGGGGRGCAGGGRACGLTGAQAHSRIRPLTGSQGRCSLPDCRSAMHLVDGKSSSQVFGQMSSQVFKGQGGGKKYAYCQQSSFDGWGGQKKENMPFLQAQK